MPVIAYDKQIRDFIEQLNATGHVTNTAYRKTSVTFHHNGARLSLQGCLDVWKVREASAHFQVDGQGAIAQYVKVNEYAWHAGNTQGNKESIGIEMANATLAPDWLVAEVTWREAARLGGWLFARVIGVRPTRETVRVHHDWKSTACAGPFIDKIREQLFLAVEAAYDDLVRTIPTTTPQLAPPPGGVLPLDQVARQVIAGSWGNGDDRTRRLRAAGYDPVAVQNAVNNQVSAAPAPERKSVEQIVDEVLAGMWGNGDARSRRLQAAGYSPSEVQNGVNARLGTSAARVVVRPDIGVIADQVIKGQWGSGTERKRRIAAAGYDYAQVQAEVNRRLS